MFEVFFLYSIGSLEKWTKIITIEISWNIKILI